MKIIKAAHGRFKLINDDGTVRYLTGQEIAKLKEKTGRSSGSRPIKPTLTRKERYGVENTMRQPTNGQKVANAMKKLQYLLANSKPVGMTEKEVKEMLGISKNEK